MGRSANYTVPPFPAEPITYGDPAPSKRDSAKADHPVTKVTWENVLTMSLKTARELGVTITAYTPLARGLLSGKYHKNPELLSRMTGWRKVSMQRNIERVRPLIQAMDEIAGKYEATIAQVALNWLINFHGEIVVTIPGATKVRQAEESAGAMNFRLSEDEMHRLDEISRRL